MLGNLGFVVALVVVGPGGRGPPSPCPSDHALYLSLCCPGWVPGWPCSGRPLTAALSDDPEGEATDYEPGTDDVRHDVSDGYADRQRRQTGNKQDGGSVLAAKEDQHEGSL